MNVKFDNPNYEDNKLYQMGYKIRVPDVFVKKFVEIWNQTYKTKINRKQAHYFILNMIENIVVIFDKGFGVILKQFLIFKHSVSDLLVGNRHIPKRESGVIEDNKSIRVSYSAKTRRGIKKALNPTEEYEEFLNQKEEVKNLMCQMYLERKRNANLGI